MPTSNFDHLFDRAALVLFEDFKKAGNPFTFLVNKLPFKYSISKGYLANRQKEVASQSLLIYNQLKCPIFCLDNNEKKQIIPANFVYGSLSIISVISQPIFEETLLKNQQFQSVFNRQNVDSQVLIKPLVIWFANDISSHLSLNDVEDRLLAETNPPDLIAVLDKGILVKLNEHTIQQIFALSQRADAQSFDKVITENLTAITQKTKNQQYFKIGATANYKNCFFFYVLLMNLLQNQPLMEDGLSADLINIWGVEGNG